MFIHPKTGITCCIEGTTSKSPFTSCCIEGTTSKSPFTSCCIEAISLLPIGGTIYLTNYFPRYFLVSLNTVYVFHLLYQCYIINVHCQLRPHSLHKSPSFVNHLLLCSFRTGKFLSVCPVWCIDTPICKSNMAYYYYSNTVILDQITTSDFQKVCITHT